MMRTGRIAAAAAGMVAAANTLGAQGWRTLDVARQLADTAPASVTVVYGTGTLGLRATPGSLLYHMELRYDPARTAPRHEFDAQDRRLRIGVQKSNMHFGSGDEEADHLQLELTRSAPLDLSLDLGAVEADLDLSGLRLSRLSVESGASDARIRFDSLNTTPMRSLEVSLGAANFRGERLANANTADIRVRAGVASVELDLGGTYTQDMDVRVNVTLGVVTIHVPSDVGVRVTTRKLIAAFEHEGLTERDGAWVSSNWESAPRKVRISTETLFGKLTIDRTGR